MLQVFFSRAITKSNARISINICVGKLDTRSINVIATEKNWFTQSSTSKRKTFKTENLPELENNLFFKERPEITTICFESREHLKQQTQYHYNKNNLKLHHFNNIIDQIYC
jgi:hypothetical protein